jgi:hypothetical protein
MDLIQSIQFLISGSSEFDGLACTLISCGLVGHHSRLQPKGSSHSHAVVGHRQTLISWVSSGVEAGSNRKGSTNDRHTWIPIDGVAAIPDELPTHQLAACVATALINSVQRNVVICLDKHVGRMAFMMDLAKGGVHRTLATGNSGAVAFWEA